MNLKAADIDDAASSTEKKITLAAQLHAYHHLGTHTPAFRIVRPEAPALTRARLGLVRAVAQVLRNGLGFLGISAPESM